MHHERPAYASHSNGRGRLVLRITLSAALFLFGGCRRQTSPEATRDEIVRKIQQGDLNEALVDVNSAYKTFGRSNEEWAWRFRILKAHILISQSSPQEALSLLADELPPKLRSTDILVRKTVAEANAYRYARDFEKSRKKLIEAEEIANSSQPRMLAEVLNSKGSLEFSEQNYIEAELTFQRALQEARKQKIPQQEASALGNLALVSISLERFGEAIDRSQTALLLSRSLKMKSLETTILGNLGWSYFQLGDFESSLQFYKQGAEGSERSGLTGYRAYWFTGMAHAFEAIHDYDAAESLSLATLTIGPQKQNVQTLIECLNTLSEVNLRKGLLSEAEQYNQEALKMEQDGPASFGAVESLLLSGRIDTLKRSFSRAETLFRSVLENRTAGSAKHWEAQARLASLHDVQGQPRRAEREYRRSIETIWAAWSSLDRDELRLSFLSGGIEFYDDYVDFLIAHGRSNDALAVAEFGRAQTLAEGLAQAGERVSFSFRHVPAQKTAQELKATLLFYWIGQKNSYLWAITPAKTTYFKLPKASDIEPLVKSYQKAVLEMHDAQDAGNSDGKQLYAMLVEPAKKLIPPGSRIILLPDSSLYGLNFETLIVPRPQPHFWIEDVTLTTANSLTLLASAAARPRPKEKTLLLVGNTEQTDPKFPVLPQAPAEMKNVKNYFADQSRNVLEGKQATPSAYLSSNPERYGYLHFVTHGTASRTRPLESAVILSKEGDSYKLYARDIVQHRLNASLVTISACNGAGTRAYSGEGLVGLSWAFLRAGAHNVIGALWEVSDASTPQLMDSLYGELSQGKDPATALRDAKLSLLHSTDSGSVFKKPFYWAPFQLYAGS
jgi:CHAT domain-containing protein